jgi:hypothetical protein
MNTKKKSAKVVSGKMINELALLSTIVTAVEKMDNDMKLRAFKYLCDRYKEYIPSY